MCVFEFYTYDDYVNWEGKWELIDGIAYAMAPSPMITHQALAYRIAFELQKSLNDCKECLVLGEQDWKVNEETVLKPDVVVICGENEGAYITKAPKIVVEVISKSTIKRDEKIKFKIYEEEKVEFYVIIYPDDLKAKVYKLKSGKFDKEGDFTQESYEFDFNCKAEVNFKEVFERFRK